MVVKITSNKFPGAGGLLGLNLIVQLMGVNSLWTSKLYQSVVALQVLYKKTCCIVA